MHSALYKESGSWNVLKKMGAYIALAYASSDAHIFFII
jgi:hypothetical protein